MRRLIAMCVFGLALTACSHVTSMMGAGGEPKTLDAATAAAQEWANRHSPGDYTGEWEMMSKQVRDRISQADFVTESKTCSKGTGIPIKATGVRMDGTDTAIVRLEVPLMAGIEQSRRVVYEDGKWVVTPGDDYAKELGKPVAQIIADEKTDGRCNGP